MNCIKINLLTVSLLILPTLVCADSPTLISTVEPNYEVYQIVQGERQLTHHWAFIIDASNSTSRVIGKLFAGFTTVIRYPTDQLDYCTYVFNNHNMYKYQDWRNASLTEFRKTNRWIRRHIGVNSYVEGALKEALKQPKKNLTIIIISDGGFSENFNEIMSIIKSYQTLRVKKGYGKAILCSIGIENHLSRLSIPPYPKDTDEVCQQRMRTIGVYGKGGYYLVKTRNYR